MPLILDTETNGLLETLDTIHCLVLRDIETNHVFSYSPDTSFANLCGPVEKGVRALQEAVNRGEVIIAHNGIDFDIPAIQKVYPWFTIPKSQVIDTLVLSRLMYADMWDSDRKLAKKIGFPGRLMNKHSLEAWGYRLGEHKGEYEGDTRIVDLEERKRRKWESWNPDMENYCVQDTNVTLKLYRRLLAEDYSPEAIQLEHDVRWIIFAQEQHGFAFDTEGAARLFATLTKEQLKLDAELRTIFTPRYLPKKARSYTPKRDNKNFGYVKDAPLTQVVLTEFSPSNRNHIVWWLKRMYGWEPTEFGKDGKPKMDETTLVGLPYPEVVKLQQYLVVDKRIGQLATGKEAWLRHERNGVIYGKVNSNGAVTGRATHSNPNLGQVPSVHAPYGKDCRALFRVRPGKVLVGADLSGLELRCLAHYMARWDGGAYGRILLEGDIHTANQKAAGLPERNMAKTFIYAFLYGAGDAKIGSIVGKGSAHGAKLRKEFLAKTPALKKLVEAVQKKAKSQKYLIGLDGRKLHVRSAHSALNTLLQSAGALISKKAMVIMRDMLIARGWQDRVHQVAWVHDENQFECDPELADEVGKMQVEAFRLAGEHFKFRVPITGEYKVGRNWAETH